MRKVYTAPATDVLDMTTEGMTCASGVTGTDGIGYGGIDENGAMEAETRMLFNGFLFD